MALLPSVLSVHPVAPISDADMVRLANTMERLTLEVQKELEEDGVDLAEQNTVVSVILCQAQGSFDKIPEKLAKKIERAYATIDYLKLVHLDGLSSHSLNVIACRFENLNSLNLSGSKLPDYAHSVLAACFNLVALNLSYCPNATTDLVSDVCSTCPQLVDFRLRGLEIKRKAMHALSKMKALECLDLSNSSVNDERLNFLTSKSINDLRINGCHTRRTDFLTTYFEFDDKPQFTPSGERYVPSVAGVTEAGFLQVVKNITSIRTIAFNGLLRDEAIDKAKQIVRERGSTFILIVRSSKTITFKGAIVDARPRMFEATWLKPKDVYPDRFAEFRGKDFKKPEVVSQALNFVDGDIQALLNGMPKEMEVARCSTRLELADCVMTKRKLKPIAEHFTDLKMLSFSKVRILDFADLTLFKKLTDLILSRYPYKELNTKEFAVAMGKFKKLDNLDISYTDVGELTFCHLVDNINLLEKINITGCDIPSAVVAKAKEVTEGFTEFVISEKVDREQEERKKEEPEQDVEAFAAGAVKIIVDAP